MRETYNVKGMTVTVSDKPRGAKASGVYAGLEMGTNDLVAGTSAMFAWVQGGPDSTEQQVSDFQGKIDKQGRDEQERANRGLPNRDPKRVWMVTDNGTNTAQTGLRVPDARGDSANEVAERMERVLRNAGVEAAQGLSDRAYAARTRTPPRASGDGLPGH